MAINFRNLTLMLLVSLAVLVSTALLYSISGALLSIAGGQGLLQFVLIWRKANGKKDFRDYGLTFSVILSSLLIPDYINRPLDLVFAAQYLCVYIIVTFSLSLIFLKSHA